MSPLHDPERRAFLARGALLLPATALLAACSHDEPTTGAATTSDATTSDATTSAATTSLAPTATRTDDDDDPTLELTEGPYYTPDSPLRRSLVEAGMRGRRLTVSGLVVDTRCRPVPRAVVDVWQADAEGAYDNEGFRLRGHQRTDSRGRYRLQTIVPGLYTGRTRHIHVKVARPSSNRVLTTQLFFPGEAGNADDGIFDSTLVMRMGRRGSTRTGRFDFVLES